MSNKIDKKAEELTELRKELGQIELDVLTKFTLADAIREGSLITTKAEGWGDVEQTACAMSAAVIAARSHGYM